VRLGVLASNVLQSRIFLEDTMPSVDRFAGCLLGGAVGDALGAPVEFPSLAEIRRRFGAAGIAALSPAYGKLGAITDDTQMTVWTAEGLLRAYTRGSARGIVSVPGQVHRAYLRWLQTQGERSAHPAFAEATRLRDNGWLITVPALRARRGPGRTCLASLTSEYVGSVEHPINDSKGCGGVMRVAPVGLLHDDPGVAFRVGCETAAITHGHPSGYLSAGCQAATIAHLRAGAALDVAVNASVTMLANWEGHQECLDVVARAVALAGSGRAPSPEVVESLGEGWTGEEALAIAVYCGLAARGDFARGVILAVNHGGDSDSTGAICGNLLGAALGVAAIPAAWLAALELREELKTLARDLEAPRPDDPAWAARYPAG
jgi:ADP-ribosylglycohydrolase